MRTRSLLCIIAFAGTTPGLATAQGVRIDVGPVAGVTRPTAALGAFAMVNDAWYIHAGQASQSAVLGASADIRFGQSRFGARVSGFTTLTGHADAFFNCRPGIPCPSVIVESSAEISTLNGLADLVFDFLPAGSFRPWLAAGGGFRHYDVSWAAPAAILDAGSNSFTLGAVHAAAGLDLDLGGSSLRAEIGGLWSPAGPRITPAAAPVSSVPSVAGRAAQTDLQLNLGWQLLRF